MKNIAITDEKHQALRIQAAKEGKTIMELTDSIFGAYIKRLEKKAKVVQ